MSRAFRRCMLRDKSLIPLSHQHQRALALMRAHRSRPTHPRQRSQSWQTEIEQHFEQEINIHFSAEEQVLFPTARQFPELASLVEELIADHAALRESFDQAKARSMSTESLPAFAQQLSNHIRKEERQLFERLQQLMSAKDLAALGIRLEEALKEAAQSCILPNQATKLKARK